MNSTPRALAILTVLLLFAVSTLAPAASQVRPPLPPGLKGKDLEKLRRSVNNNNKKRQEEYERKKKEEADRYHVVQIGLKFEVVQKKNLAALKKSAPRKYKAQLSEYTKARSEAKEKGEKFKGLKPPSTVFKVLTRKGYKKEKDAKLNAGKLQPQVASKRKK